MVSCQKRWVLVSTNSVAFFSFVVFKLDANEKEQLESSLDGCVRRCRPPPLHRSAVRYERWDVLRSACLPPFCRPNAACLLRVTRGSTMLKRCCLKLCHFTQLSLANIGRKLFATIMRRCKFCRSLWSDASYLRGKQDYPEEQTGKRTNMRWGDIWVQTNKPTNKQINHVVIHIWSSEDFFIQ